MTISNRLALTRRYLRRFYWRQIGLAIRVNVIAMAVFVLGLFWLLGYSSGMRVTVSFAPAGGYTAEQVDEIVASEFATGYYTACYELAQIPEAECYARAEQYQR